jgi:hypothetical protein
LELVEAENVMLPDMPSRMVRAQIIEVICKSRYPTVPAAVHMMSEDVDPEDVDPATVHVMIEDTDEEENVEQQDVDVAADEEMEKKILDAVNNIDQLKAIVAKEKIVMGPGRKKKIHYINAIYSARHPPPPPLV